jgi:hypothetical protein
MISEIKYRKSEEVIRTEEENSKTKLNKQTKYSFDESTNNSPTDQVSKVNKFVDNIKSELKSKKNFYSKDLPPIVQENSAPSQTKKGFDSEMH